MSVPNQRIIINHKEEYEGNFLQIRKDYLINAFNTLQSYSALYFYLILASNSIKFKLEYSPKAILNQFGMPETTCRTNFDLLVQHGFLVRRGEKSNIYDFYETPYGKSFIKNNYNET